MYKSKLNSILDKHFGEHEYWRELEASKPIIKKTCSKCKVTKTSNDFYDYGARCKECIREVNKLRERKKYAKTK